MLKGRAEAVLACGGLEEQNTTAVSSSLCWWYDSYLLDVLTAREKQMSLDEAEWDFIEQDEGAEALSRPVKYDKNQ